VVEGFRTVLGSPWLWITLCVLAVTNMMLAGPYSVALPFLIDEQYGGDVNLLGILYAVFPIGYVLGGIWLGRKRNIRRRGMLAHGGLIVAGLGMLIIGLPIPFPLKLVAALFNGAGLEVLNLIWYNTLPELVPNDRLGRVSSIDLLVSYALLPVGFALAGWMTNAFGAATTCIVGGGITIVAASLSLLHPAVRGLD
jgi:MFS family permease